MLGWISFAHVVSFTRRASILLLSARFRSIVAFPYILRDEGEDPALCATPAARREAIHGKVADAIIGFLARVEK